MPEDMPEDMSEYMPEDMSDRMPEDMSEYMPEDMPDRMPEDMSDRVPEDMPDRMPEDLPDRMPEDMPEDMPDHMPEDMPDRMSNRMSEDMSDRMPEDLPVRKCINVMVGITRSKVICSFLAERRKGWLEDFDQKTVRHTGETQRGERKGRHNGKMMQNEKCQMGDIVVCTRKSCFCKILKCQNCTYLLNIIDDN